jgi:hypothetical protein
MTSLLEKAEQRKPTRPGVRRYRVDISPRKFDRYSEMISLSPREIRVFLLLLNHHRSSGVWFWIGPIRAIYMAYMSATGVRMRTSEVMCILHELKKLGFIEYRLANTIPRGKK